VAEIERKFVVDRLPEGADLTRGDEILQGYLVGGEVEVRLRRRATKHFLTFKASGDLVREEVEIEIGEDEFARLWPFTAGRRLEKRRVLVPSGAGTIEVDVFGGKLTGLVMAELEFSTVQEAEAFEPPGWFGREVTAEPGYKNQRLAVDGLPVDHGRSLGDCRSGPALKD
jgi:adenylate cyclase